MTRRWSTTGLHNLAGLYSLTFCSNSSGETGYLDHISHDRDSRERPAIVPFASRIVRITYSNQDTGVDCDVQVLAAPMGSENNTASTIINWPLRNVRAACGCFEIDVNECDKIAVFLKDQGKNSDDPRVIIWLVPLSDDCTDDSDNLSTDFPTTGGTTT